MELTVAQRRTRTLPKQRKVVREKRPSGFWRIALIVLTVCVALAASGASAWAYNYLKQDLGWYTGNPNAQSFTISTSGELHAFSALVNGDAKDTNGDLIAPVSFEGKTVVMASGLNLFGQEFTPIGTAEHPFAGTFEGKVISRLSITGVAGTNNVGLFGVTAPTATIRGVQLSQNSLISLSVSDPAQHMDNIGAVVGLSNGRIENCSSAARLVINHTVVEGLTTIPANNIGGVVGTAKQGMVDCSATGSLEFRSSALVFVDAANAGIYTIGKNIGGVAGSVNGSLTNSHNSSSMLLITSGTGGSDRFGISVQAKTVGVGGVAGYADGNVDGCSNSGTILSSTNPNATFEKLGAQDEPQETLEAKGGADGCGGVIGLYRAEMGVGSMTGGGSDGGGFGQPLITLSNCSNTGSIAGLHAVGGVVGVAGNDTLITRCTNGVAGDISFGFVRTTRWNKAATGGIAGQTFGDVSWSRNHGLIDNTGAAYYTAGIVGMLLDTRFQPRDPEIYSCYNTGIIYGSSSVRSGAIVGENNGYIHDNVFLYGSINSQNGYTDAQLNANSRASGTDNLGMINNTSVVYETSRQATEKGGLWIKSGEAIAILNTLSASFDWQDYYFISNSVNNGYPVLNGEASSEGAVDLSQVVATIKLHKQARYSSSYNPAPVLKVSIVVDGQTIELIDGADFRVLPDPEALDSNGVCKGITSGVTPYTARIEGIGSYTGSPATTVSYGIDKGKLSECLVMVKGQTYNGEPQNDPAVTVLDGRGLPVPAENYSYVINNGQDCVNFAMVGYPVVVTANENGNYDGEARGIYHIVQASLFADCDVIGIYLDSYTVGGVLREKSVWYFDEEESDIYEVKPILDNDGEFQWTEQGLILVEGMQEYASTDGRVLTRATPLRTDANGQPVYGDLEVDYTGKAIQPKTIAVLHEGELVMPQSSSGGISTGDYITQYGHNEDATIRLMPRNVNATHDESQPEASILISARAVGSYSNFS
ncbi:MAG: hypothetical protein LBH64_00820, partial [Coriobacteriales bacterium]|nr:hypothetical protein [Coriobacteriales bacterium]